MSDDKNDSGSDSIYRAPTSNTTVTSGDNLMAAYVGPKNAHYYDGKFDKFESGGGAVSWNWPSFFLTWFWLMYRKMWMWSFVYWLGVPLILTAISAVISANGSPYAGIIFYYASYAVVGFLLAPILANKLYYNHVRGKVNKMSSTTLSADQQATELSRIGGTSKIVLILVPIILVMVVGILAAIAIPAYQDYTVRAQVSEGMNLASGAKAAVTESYMDREVLPRDNAEAGLAPPNSIVGSYVSSVEVSDGVVIITYGVAAHTVIDDKTIVLQPEVGDDSSIIWTCSSPTIAAKHLPAACR